MAAEPLPLPVIDDGPPRLSLAPEYPPGVPVPDPPIVVIGRDVHQTWDKVWHFIQHKADPIIEQMQDQTLHLLAQAVPAIQAYTGEALKAMGGYINDVGDFATEAITTVAMNMASFASWTWTNVLALDVALYGAITHINDLEGRVVPALEGAIVQAYSYAYNEAHAVGADVERWAADNIFAPLVDELGQVNANIRHDVWALVAGVAGGLQAQIDGNALRTFEVLGPLAAAVGELQKFKDDCAQPMCDYAGPNTDLGKLMKAFQLAGILALLMEIGNMTESDIEDRLRELASDAQHIVSAFEGTFVGGGGTLRDFALSLV